MTQAAAIDRTAESLLAFWAEAGVDAMLLDAPIDRIEAGKFIAPKPPEKKPLLVAPVRPGALDVDGAVAQARHVAAEAQDLEALKAAIAAFDGCPLKLEGARQSVFARGAPDAPLMVIGEGPGPEEDARGEPFVGQAGQMLDRILGAAGLTDRVFITNTVFWRPPGNRTPTLAEQAICLAFTRRHIELARPKLLVLAGGTAVKAVLDTTEGITRLRGKWATLRLDDGTEVPALPTFHPAYLLRTPASKRQSWWDLLSVDKKLKELGAK